MKMRTYEYRIEGMAYLIESRPFWVLDIAFVFFVHQGPLGVDGALDKVFIHDPDQGVVFIKPQLSEKWLADLVDVANDYGRKEDFWEGHRSVQGRLNGGAEELGGVVAQEESAGHDGQHHDHGPEGGPEGVEARTLRALGTAAALPVLVAADV